MRSSEVWSHPNRALIDHACSVGKTAEQLAERLPPVHAFSTKLPSVAYIVGMLHDYGKATTFFQDKIRQKEYNAHQARHSHLSAIVSLLNVWDYFELENYKSPELNIPLFAYLVTKRHHGNLGTALDDLSLKSTDMDIFNSQLEEISDDFVMDLRGYLKEIIASPLIEPEEISERLPTIKKILRSYKKILRRKKTNLRDTLELSCLYSLLIDADKLDASRTGLVSRASLPDDFIVNHVKNLGSPTTEINRLRTGALSETLEFAENVNLNQRMMSLTLPTGLGKTYSVMALAQRLRARITEEKGYTPRIIYCLPFTSIIDQNWSDLYQILDSPASSVLVKHHHLGDTKYRTMDNEDYGYDQSGLLIEGWNSEIVITTFVQLFFTLAGYRNRSLRRFHNMAGSIVILDEVQSIPHKYWRLFRKLALKMTESMGTRFILVTATQPRIFDEVPEVIANPAKYFTRMSRVRFDIDLTEFEFDDFSGQLIDSLEEKNNHDLLLIFNTKKAAEQMFSSIKDEAFDADLIFLTTSVIPRQRMERIQRLRENSSGNRIVVSTQIVEAGVDIDFRHVIRDFAPLDSIVQAAGRCNRHMKWNEGICSVKYLIDGSDAGRKRPFSSYIYDATLLNTTQKILEKHSGFDDSKLHEITSEYFDTLAQKKSEDVSKKILSSVRKLDYQAFSDVELIEDGPLMSDVFIEYDSDASEVLMRYREILDSNMPRFKKRAAFLEIRRELMEYVISVPVRNLDGAMHEVGSLVYIPMDDLGRRYDEDTGFIAIADSAYIL